MLRLLLLGFTSFVFAAQAHAAASIVGPEVHLFANVSAFFPEPAYVSTDESGNVSFFDPAYAAIGPQGSLFLTESIRFEPALAFVLPWRKNIDGNQRYYTTLLKLHGGYFINPRTEILLGPGVQWTYIHGDQQTVTQYNGTSSSTFFTPEVSESLFLATVDVGVAYYLFSSLRIQLEFSIADIMSSARRRTGFSFGAGYAFL